MNQAHDEKVTYCRLPAGRVLCFAEYGDRSGVPVLYCHGYPASHLEAQLADRVAHAQGVRLIVPDRPGYGRSEPLPGRTFADWVNDSVELANQLNLQRFSVLGVSGGGPFAAALAAARPDVIQRLGLLCPLGPLDSAGSELGMAPGARFMMRLARHFPQVAKLLLRYVLAPAVRARPMLTVRMILADAPPADRAVLLDKSVLPILLANYRHALMVSSAGAERDLELYTKPWAIDWPAIRCETHIWHGTEDKTVPLRVATDYAGLISGSHLHELAGDGHFSAIIRRMPEILRLVSGKG